MKPVIVAAAFMAAVCCLGAAFQGGITVAVSQGGQTRHLLYTVGTNSLRVECTDAGYPYPRDIVNMRSGAIIILFPNNRSFMKLPGKSPAPSGSPMSRIGPMPVPGAPAMPMIPRPAEPLELKATGRTTNILGYACASYELINRAEVMDIWATKELPPFQPYLQGQPP
ncbi:MAG: hypothetical protein KGR98_06145, partial [Verrucomicrobia bacterium]|nr:hypothetical protein [Verrucomicrobiota bacterium]